MQSPSPPERNLRKPTKYERDLFEIRQQRIRDMKRKMQRLETYEDTVLFQNFLSQLRRDYPDLVIQDTS